MMHFYNIPMLISLISLICVIGCKGASVDHQATIEVLVLTNGVPIEGVDVRGGFESELGRQKGTILCVPTNTNGVARLSAKTSGQASIQVCSDQHYTHYEDLDLFRWVRDTDGFTNLVIELKPVLDPTSMYTKHEKKNVPKIEEFFGYDFKVGDWVAPHGKGKKKDILFKPHFSSADRYNYSVRLEVRFPGQYNGIQPMPREYPERQGSKLRSAHEAPANGYIDYLDMSRFKKGRTEDHGDFSEKEREGYYFRIRSVVDKDGNLVSAQYGKVYGSFHLYGGILNMDLGLSFTYYFNPDKTRNVEFDPRNNLFLKGHKGREPLHFSVNRP